MGRSTGYCFKIIACGGGSSESVDRDDLVVSSENKGSDKRGWSFRKKSAPVVSNTVITERPASENKSSEPVIIDSEAPVGSSVSEKTSANLWTEELPRVSNSVTKFVDEDDIKLDSIQDESYAIVIQTAIRKFLAQRELVKYKNIVKLQASIRGHLVRCRAAGTLRCIQAIVKMQALVRARNAKLSLDKSSTKKKRIQDSRTKQHLTYISIEKLLSNRFAIQLLESTPRNKQFNIKCDPNSLNDDPSWKWMERWTSVSSPDIVGSHETIQVQDNASETKAQIENVTSSHQKLINSHAQKSPTEGPLVYESLKVGRSQTGGSECGTELSVTSMLDSPDPSEVGNVEYEKEVRVLDKGSGDTKTFNVEEHDFLGTELTHSVLFPSEKYAEQSKPDNDTESEQPKPDNDTENTVNEQQSMLETKRLQQMEKFRSHEESPRTPSSQLSKNKTKTDKKLSSQKQKSWSNSSKKSPASSGLRNILDDLPSESKPGKRRNSFGSQTSDQIDQEPRESSSSNSIPSYMQVTESARAKALANRSLRSSPDTNGTEGYMKKRHSLPGGGNGRHGSPRITRPSPPTAKGYDSRERKWQN